MHHGWTATEIVKTELFARNVQDPDGNERSRVHQHFILAKAWGVKALPGLKSYTHMSLGDISDKRGRSNKGLGDYRIIDLADGVAVHPSGVDKGLLTAVIQRVLEKKDEKTMLSDLVEYVNVHFDELNKDLIPIDTDAADHG
jgi:hypothetical protein